MKKIIYKIIFCLFFTNSLFSQCISGDCNNGIGKYLYPKGDKYEGEFKDGKLHGQGIYTWSEGSYYQGYYLLNKRWGIGKLVWSNGDVYEGDFLNDERNGFGKLILANGEVREGNWVAGQFTGKGKKTLITGEITEGYFVGGLWLDTNDTKYVKGFKTITSETGSYTGNYIYGKTWGRGTLNWTSGASYTGEWINNKRTGKGIFKFKNGDIYEGEFVEDKMTGFGTLTKVNGEKKTGYWVDNNIILITDSQIANNNEIQQTSPNHTQNITSNSNLTVSTSKLNNPSTTKSIVKDADGKVYKTVVIGTQTWMAENLNVDRFRNGDLIPHAKTDEEWQKAKDNKQPAWCYLDNVPDNNLGKLYNWFAVMDPRGLAPIGWHIPSTYEWEQLKRKCGGSSDKLKSKGVFETKVTYHEVGGYDELKWVSCSNCSYWTERQRANNPCSVCRNKKGKYIKTGNYIPKRKERREEKINLIGWDGNNELGFNALPYGTRGSFGKFYNKEWSVHTSWWSSIDYSFCCASFATLSDYLTVWNEEQKGSGLSVRCVKD